MSTKEISAICFSKAKIKCKFSVLIFQTDLFVDFHCQREYITFEEKNEQVKLIGIFN